MQWIEATVETSADRIESISSMIQEYDVTGISIEDENDFQQFLENNRQFWDYVDETLEAKYSGVSRIRFYVENNEAGQKIIDSLREKLSDPISVTILKDEDWGNSWKQYYEPISIDPGILIVPEWLEVESGSRKIVRIDPGIGFGTGSHPTTQMTLRLLQSVALEGTRVLDLGCGSGILGISALVLGCREVVGCDIDPKARESVHNNLILNAFEPMDYSVMIGDLLKDKRLQDRLGNGFDVVLANIVADVIIPLSAFVRKFFSASGSYFICSGIIQDRAAEVESALVSNGLTVLNHLQQEEWHAFLCK